MLIKELPPECLQNIIAFLTLKDWCTIRQTSKIFHVDSHKTVSENLDLLKILPHLRDNPNKGLKWACKKGSEFWVDYFLDKGASNWVLACTGSGYGGHINLFNRFIKKVDLRNHSHLSLKISFSICKGYNKQSHDTCIKLLKILNDHYVSHNPENNSEDFFSWEGFCANGDMDMIKLKLNLIDNDDEYIHRIIGECMYYASRYGHIDAVDHLLNKYKNIIDPVYWVYVLIYGVKGSAKSGHKDIVSMFFTLINELAPLVNDRHLIKKLWLSSLYSSAKGGQYELFIFLYNNNKFRIGNRIMRKACYGGNMELINFLINNGFKASRACIIEASKKGNVNLVEMLIQKYNFNLNNKNFPSEYPLYDILNCGYISIVKLLLNRGVVFQQHHIDLCHKNGNDYLIKYLTASKITKTHITSWITNFRNLVS